MINKYCIVRIEGTGVYFGKVKKIGKDMSELIDARRLWFWSGAASLSQLSQEGTCRPKDCKFPIPVELVVFPTKRILEILPCTDAAIKSLREVSVWNLK